MACDCISKVDAFLKPLNTRLGASLVFASQPYATVAIVTEQLERGKGKKGATRFIAAYCPVCGVKYEEKETRK